MKNIVLNQSLLLMLFLVSGLLQAQGLMVDVNIGYSIPSAGVRTETEYTSNFAGNSGTEISKTKLKSLGSGFNLGVAGLYSFNENIAAGVGINYLLGSPVKTSTTNNVNGDNSVYENSMKSRFLRINPHVYITAGNKTISPYARFGILLGIGSIRIEEDYKETSGGVTDQMHAESQYSGGMSLGWNCAFGVGYELSDKINLFGELNVISMHYSPTKGKVNVWTVNGEDVLKDTPTNEKEVRYKNEITSTWGPNTTPPNKDVPDEQLRFSLPMSSFGINIGIRFRI